MASHIVLEESGEKYEAKRMDLAKGEQRTEAYLKIHPLGRVPALLLDNGEPLTENTAILPYLGKRFGLWPKDPLAEAKALSMIGYFASSVHPAHAHISRPERYATDKSYFPDIQEQGKKTFHGYLKQIDGMLAGRAVALRPVLRARSLWPSLLRLGRAPRAADGRAEELHRLQGPHAAAPGRAARRRGREGQGLGLLRGFISSRPRRCGAIRPSAPAPRPCRRCRPA